MGLDLRLPRDYTAYRLVRYSVVLHSKSRCAVMDENTLSSPSSEPVAAEVVPPLDFGSVFRSRPAEPVPPNHVDLTTEPVQSSSRWREIAVLLPLIVLADMTIYRGHGYAGLALLFVLAPLLFVLGSPRLRCRASFWILGSMLVILAANLLWCGTVFQVVLGFALLVAFAMSLSGRTPYVLNVLVYACQALPAGLKNLLDHIQSSSKAAPILAKVRLLNVIIPLGAILVFGSLFILANPDLVSAVRDAVEEMFRSLHVWVAAFGLTGKEVVFWFFVIWIAAGLLRPMRYESILDQLTSGKARAATHPVEPAQSMLYMPFRNTLLALIVLFAVYLPFEFATLWFREFPKGFYYAGYAHEGAAWLTVALALATGVLSLVFRGSILHDPRLPQLRRLTWIWVFENALLAAAVYNRLMIYVGFNGMTRMRTVGLFGMTLVVAGFILVVWKVVHRRDFAWLVRRQLWALAITVYLFVITPVDALVHSYNVRQILAGDLAPSVQISVHPIDSEGILVLPPLLDCDDAVIREGICAMLAQRYLLAQDRSQRRARVGWTAHQQADELLHSHLTALREYWEPYLDHAKRSTALTRFRAYTYQWY